MKNLFRFLGTMGIMVIGFQAIVFAVEAPHIGVTSIGHSEPEALAASLQKAKIILGWNMDTSQGVQITIYDSSTSETGYCIYRNDGTAMTLLKIASIKSAIPNEKDLITWYDTTAQTNKWYAYAVAAYIGADSIFSDTSFTYTFRDYQPKTIKKLTLIGELPLSVSGWSAKVGDSIILKENNSPEGKFTVINVENPTSPFSAGYIDSITLLSYPAKSLIPFLLKRGISNNLFRKQAVVYKNQVLLLDGNGISRYLIDSDYAPLDTFHPDSRGYNMFFISDSILCLTMEDLLSYVSFVKITDSGLSMLPENFTGGTMGGTGNYVITLVNPQGFADSSTIVITSDRVVGSIYSRTETHSVFAYDIQANRLSQQETTIPLSAAINTGYYLSPSESINIHKLSTKNQLFVSDVRDSRGYQTALRYNTGYVDSNISINILLDTAGKSIFLVSNTKLSVLKYAITEISVFPHSIKISPGKRSLTASSPNGSGIMFTVSGSVSKHMEICLYDLFGRMVDKITAMNTNNITWRPKKCSAKCFIAVATIDRERLVTKGMLKF